MTSTCSGSPSCVRRRAAPAGWWWGGHDRAGRRVREQLERERRAMHHLTPAPAIARPAQPAPPARHGGVELGGDVGIGVRRRGLARLDAVKHEDGRPPGPGTAICARTSPPSKISSGQRVERLSTSSAERNSAPCGDRKSTRLNSNHRTISYAVFCLKKKTKNTRQDLAHHKQTNHQRQ